MRRTLAIALVALTAFAGPAAADPVKFVHHTVKDALDSLDDCMDCIPPVCQLAGGCAKP
ncbi:MAG TPA: hypothetical protein VNA20_04945 [Frankiaceae bacterium]|nr:hypothetical protein [Frankiaceae bacterium]